MSTKHLRSKTPVSRMRIVDPATKIQYVLVRADVFEQMLGAAEEFDPRDSYPFVDDVMRAEDASDPTLDRYQHARSAAKAR